MYQPFTEHLPKDIPRTHAGVKYIAWGIIWRDESRNIGLVKQKRIPIFLIRNSKTACLIWKWVIVGYFL